MEFPMHLTLQDPDNAIERRRQQNRLAQRKFRRKQIPLPQVHQNTVSLLTTPKERRDARQQEMSNNADTAVTPSTAGTQVSAPQQIPIPQHPSASASANPLEFAALPMPTSNASNSSSGIWPQPGITPGTEDVNFWDYQLDSLGGMLLDGENAAPAAPIDPSLASSSSSSAATPSSGANPTTTTTITTTPTTTTPSSSGSTTDLVLPPMPSFSSSSSSSPGRSPSLNDRPRMVPHGPGADNGWLSALHIATQRGRERIVRVLLQSSKALDVNGGDSDWRTPLMHAAAGGHEGVVELLLAHGARVDVTDRESRSALHWAVLHGRERVLRLMLEGAAETGVLDEVINSYDSAGWTPLHSAVHKGFEPGLLLLLEFGANQAFMARKCPYANEKEAGDSSDQ